ncbi:MAG: alpha/beta hydrolase [Hamadaea sp.]|nr:alpha/beta hydrolase [Hamadaea sp.]
MDRGIVLLPGANLGPWAPLLTYAWLAGIPHEAETLPITWPTPIPSFAEVGEVGAWIDGQIGPELDTFAVDRPVLVGKSLGAYAAGIAADRELPAIWLTPHLEQDWLVGHLRRATAPFLLVGGTADPVWRGDVARRLTPHVVEIAEANHGLVLPGRPLAESAHALGRIATAYEEFLQLVWA